MTARAYECLNTANKTDLAAGVIERSSQAKYQQGETCIGLDGSGAAYMEGLDGDLTNLTNQERLLNATDLLVQGIKPTKELLDAMEKKPWTRDAEDHAETIKVGTPITALRKRADQKGARGSTDINFGAPKSVSILLEELDRRLDNPQAGDDVAKLTKMRDNIIKAMSESVHETMGEWEKLAMRRDHKVLKGEDRKTIRDDFGKPKRSDADKLTGNVIYTAFLHRDTRPVEMPDREILAQLQETLGKENVRYNPDKHLIEVCETVNIPNPPKGGEAQKRKVWKSYIRDPHLHVHVQLANLTYDQEDHEWYALQKGEMMRHMPYFESLASSKLAAKLEAMGLDVERHNSRWELATFVHHDHEDTLIRKFCKSGARTQNAAIAQDLDPHDPRDRAALMDIIRHHKYHGIENQKINRLVFGAQLNTQDHEILDETIHNAEVNAANQKNTDYQKLRDKNYEHRQQTPEKILDDAIANLSKQTPVLEFGKVMAEALKLGVSMSADDLYTACRTKFEDAQYLTPETYQTERPDSPSKLPQEMKEEKQLPIISSLLATQFTTKALWEEESKLTQLLMRGGGYVPSLQDEYKKIGNHQPFIPSSFPARDYNDNQKQVMQQVLDSNQRVMFIQGNAGVGKTTVALQLAHAIAQSGHRIIPVTVANAARDVLEREGFGQYFALTKENEIVLEQNPKAPDKMRPKMLNYKDAKDYYAKLYGGESRLPKRIATMLESNKMGEPLNLTQLMNKYKQYKTGKGSKSFKADMEGQVLLVDEVGQLGTAQALELMEMVQELHMRVIMMGDPKQHGSVTRGNIFEMLKLAGIEEFRLSKVVRQTGELAVATNLAAEGQVDGCVRKLREMGSVVQLNDAPPESFGKEKDLKSKKNLMKLQVWQDAQLQLQGKTVFGIAGEHKDMEAMDTMRREFLSDKKFSGSRYYIDASRKANITTVTPIRNADETAELKKGMAIKFLENYSGGIPKSAIATIERVNRSKGTMEVICEGKQGVAQRKKMTLPIPKKLNPKLMVLCNTKDVEICKGDRITITQNITVPMSTREDGPSYREGISNGDAFWVRDVSTSKEGEVTLKLENDEGRWITLTPSTDVTHRHFRRGFYNTSYSAQGGTLPSHAHVSIWHPEDSLGNFYVEVTRLAGARPEGMRIYTENAEALAKSLATTKTRQSALQLMQRKGHKIPEHLQDPEHAPKGGLRYLYDVEVGQDGVKIGQVWWKVRRDPQALRTLLMETSQENLSKLGKLAQTEWTAARPRSERPTEAELEHYEDLTNLGKILRSVQKIRQGDWEERKRVAALQTETATQAVAM